MSVETFKIVQTDSPIRRHWTQRQTLIGLKLNKIGRIAEVPNTRATWGITAAPPKADLGDREIDVR